MSAGPGRREVAYRVFAAEYDDATVEYAESDEERAPTYVVLPGGARVNRLFVVGTLTEVDRVNEEMVRARIVDPTGAFVVYAGQYQPEALAFFEDAEPPAFVALTGKARTFQPEDGDRIYTSVRPEEVAAVDADIRDRWVLDAAEHTIERVAAFAAVARLIATPGIDLDLASTADRGALTEALTAAGLQPGLAAGIPMAIAEYGTTAAYLAALRRLGTDAIADVAGEREGVRGLDLAPDDVGDGGPAYDELAIDVPFDPSAARDALAGRAPDDGGEGSPAAEPSPAETNEDWTGDDAREGAGPSSASSSDESESEETATEPAQEPVAATAGAGGTAGSHGETEAAESVDAGTGVDSSDSSGEDDSRTAGDVVESSEANGSAEGEAAVEPVEDPGMYEFDDEERAEIEAEHDVSFTAASEVDPGEQPADGAAGDEDGVEAAPEESTSVEDGDGEAAAPESEPTDTSGPDTDESADDTADEATERGEDASDEADADTDLETVVVETMVELDDGDGAPLDELVESVGAETGADAEAVEAAIQDALMGGRCFESGDERYTAI